jgi:hypothetical protein
MLNKKNKNENKISPTCHAYEIEDAVKYGINAAVILCNIKFWLEKNMKDKRNFYDNRVWTFNSVTNFKKLYPELTYEQIKYALKKLEKKGAVVVGNYNKRRYDKTKWYSTSEYSLVNVQSELDNAIDKSTNND